MEIGIIGGTGAFGSGMAARLASWGHRVRVGSRDVLKSSATVTKLHDQWDLPDGVLVPCGNEVAAKAGVVMVALPWSSLKDTIAPLGPVLVGKTVLSPVNRISPSRQGPLPVRSGDAAAWELQQMLTGSQVATAFNHLPARAVSNPKTELDSDILVCSDFVDAFKVVEEMTRSAASVRPVYVGPLVHARAVEDFTSAIVSANIQNKRQSGLRFTDHVK